MEAYKKVLLNVGSYVSVAAIMRFPDNDVSQATRKYTWIVQGDNHCLGTVDMDRDIRID